MSGSAVEGQDPTRCDLCDAAIVGAWCQTLDASTGEVTETRCPDCDERKRLAGFRETGRLTTRLVESALLRQALGKQADPDVLRDFAAIPPQIKHFEHEVRLSRRSARRIPPRGGTRRPWRRSGASCATTSPGTSPASAGGAATSVGHRSGT